MCVPSLSWQIVVLFLRKPRAKKVVVSHLECSCNVPHNIIQVIDHCRNELTVVVAIVVRYKKTPSLSF